MSTHTKDFEPDRRRRPRRRLSAHVAAQFLNGVCGAVGTLELLNWTSSWQPDCSQRTFASGPLCYYVDQDRGNDAEPWQEIERVTFERWLSSPFARRQHQHQHQPADIVVVPSALAHCRASSGWRLYPYWQEAMVDGRTDVHEAYWNALRTKYGSSSSSGVGGHYHNNNNTSSPLLVITYDGTWQMAYGHAMLTTLAKQPASFIRRIVLCSIESAMQLTSFATLFKKPEASPTFVTLPFSILAAGVVHAAHERRERPISLLFSGRPHSAFDKSRQAVYEQLKAAGGTCVDGRDQRVTCALCADGGSTCVQEAFRELRKQSWEDPALSLGAIKVLALASRSTLCLEPTSDTLVRSHFYAAALMGCVPVIFDTSVRADGTPFYPRTPRPYLTEWAWRIKGVPRTPRRETFARLPGGSTTAETTMDYSSFSVVESVAPLMRDERSGLIRELQRLATSPEERSRLRKYQRALASAAELMRYDRGVSSDAVAMPAGGGGGGGGGGGMRAAVIQRGGLQRASAARSGNLPGHAARGAAASSSQLHHSSVELCPQTAPAPCDAFSMLALYLKALAVEAQ